MSIQTVEIALPTGIDSVSVGLAEPIAIVEVRQGPAGGSVINAATQSDGTADLDLLNVETVTATVSGTLTAPHIHGNLAGSVYAHIRAGEALAKGDPVYVSGSHGSGSTLIPIVSKADASNAAKMPAVGIMDADVANNANGHMVITGTITELNTAAYSVNAELYVAAGGGMTATPPTARAQPVARVERANLNNGAVIVKVNGLSASDATGNTLVRRTSTGGASFGPLTTGPLSATAISSDTHLITSSAGTTITGPLTLSGTGSNTLSATYSNTISLTGTTGVTIAGGTLTLNSSGFAYGTGAAAAHRTALGVGTTDAPTFAGATFAAGTITTSQPLTLTQTWNNAATTFTGLQVNVTDTASNAASLLMDLQADGLSKFRVKTQPATGPNSDGFLWEAITNGGVFSINGSGNTINLGQSANHDISLANGQAAVFRSGAGGGLRIGSAALSPRLYADSDNTLAQRNGVNAQESRIYGTYADGSNYRRLALKMSSAGVAQIVAEGAGSGASGNVLQLPSNTTFADAAATRTALGFDAAVPKIPILFSNSSDFTTSSTSFVSVTGLSFPVAANKNYQVSFHLNTNKNDANGIQYQITGPASPTRVFGRVILFTSSTSTSAADIPTAFNAASTTFNTFSGDSLAFSSPAIIISNGANAGTVQIQIRAVTGGTAKIYAGSWLQITEL
jgi:hypothetical protein